MKRILLTILAFVYLALASGVGMNIHYCMGELSSVDYGYKKAGHCDECGMEEKAGCCNTEFKVVKLQDSHQWSSPGELVKNFLVVESFFNTQSYFSARPFNSANRFTYHSPPDKRLNEVYLHTTVFRI
ncbi:MAG: HYC_CC_PP family protein [Flavitalea sp.]